MSQPAPEPILDPARPIIDAHHHFWFVPQAALDALEAQGDESALILRRVYSQRPRYMFDELLADARAGHDVRATVFVESHTWYKTSGAEDFRSVGEIEVANGMAALADSGVFGDVKVCAAIIGGLDLRKGDLVPRLLEAQVAAGGGRHRGIRASSTSYDEHLPVLGGAAHVLLDPAFHRGVKELQTRDLLCELFLFEPQLPDLIDLARATPDQTFILNHVGSPTAAGGGADRLAERMPIWRANLEALGRLPNVAVKLGGLGNPFSAHSAQFAGRRPTSEALADAWRPIFETCIEAFGADRCLFESNFPVDGATADYAVVWNAFKRIAEHASEREKDALFSGTAARLYRIAI
jgi:predicted TIM-barrel fold metal-dependent hydrolase